MALSFPSDEWIKALMDDVNRSEAYARAAHSWEGDLYFVVEPDDGAGEPAVLYVDLWHGKCRAASLVQDIDAHHPAYRLSAPLATWKKVIARQLDPMQGLLTRQLKLQGNMVMILRNIKAAQELVECATHIPTEYRM